MSARWAVRMAGRMCGMPLLAAALGGALMLWAGSALAEPGRTTWTTFLYQGPGPHYAVTDEINALQPIDVGACTGGWCQVTYGGRSGFVLAEVVVRGNEDPANPPPGVLAQPAADLAATPKGPCFTANEKGGNGGNALNTYCAK